MKSNVSDNVLDRKNRKIFYQKLLKNKDFSITLLTFILILVFIAVNRTFIDLGNILTIIKNIPELGLVALGMTMLIITGEFDLSVGSIFGLSPFIMAYLITKVGVPEWMGFLTAIAAGAMFGLINGLIVTKIKIPSFIATLGTMEIYRGILLLISGGFPLILPVNSLLVKVFTTRIHNFPIQFIWFILCAAIMYLLLENRKFGNWTLVTGGNRQAAIAMGIPVDLVKILNFMIIGMLSAFAGSIQVFRIHSATPLTGTGMELNAIAATVIGGTLLTGGSGSIVGAVMGTFILFSVDNILILSGAPGFWFRLFIGLVIILTVSIHIFIRKERQL
ncbi:MAG: ABC transporter permease [Actinobacteria bacterium]|nr:ABC transporter permease [Actinomycetota bacterium]